MKKIQLKTRSKTFLADTVTPVSIYLKLRDQYPNSILLEGADFHTQDNSFSFICLEPIAGFTVDAGVAIKEYPDSTIERMPISKENTLVDMLNEFRLSFEIKNENPRIPVCGLFGYCAYDSVQYFEDIKFKSLAKDEYRIPEIKYNLFRYAIAINHLKNEVNIIENYFSDDQESQIEQIHSLINNKNFATFPFYSDNDEQSNLTNEEYLQMVTKGKEHCFKGDVIQIVLSRQFSQSFKGDEFNVYRALRSINPSPYLFYFDYGSFKIFGSSPETQLIINGNRAQINPIAGTYKRTGDDIADMQLAEELSVDPKENAEHVMLVDLARNDLGRNAKNVRLTSFREIQYFSHVLHMVSKVVGDLNPNTNVIKVVGDSFPAGTLSGAPKYKAMEIIDRYENQSRGYYGGCIGYLGFNGDFNHAIMIRSFLSKNNRLYYQAGAGVVAASVEESELNEVNNKLAALKKAVDAAKSI